MWSTCISSCPNAIWSMADTVCLPHRITETIQFVNMSLQICIQWSMPTQGLNGNVNRNLCEQTETEQRLIW